MKKQIALFSLCLSVTVAAQAAQIAPNPNPVANTIVIAGGESDSNSVPLTNNGWITVQHGNTVLTGGVLTNSSTGTLTNNGLIQSQAWNVNSGSFINQGLVENYGTVQGPASNELGAIFNNHVGATGGIGNYGTVNNEGTFSVINGSTGVVTNTGLLLSSTNDNGGLIDSSGEIRVGDPSQSFPFNLGSLQTLGSVINTGVINVNDGGHVTVQGQFWAGLFGDIDSDGDINLTGPTALLTVESGAELSGTGVYTQDGGTTRVEAVTYDDGSGPVDYIGRITQGEIIINDGFLTGTGVLESINAPLVLGPAATVLPGNSPGTLTIDGSMELGGTYEAEIDGVGNHDVLHVTDTVTLEGTSFLSLLFNYAPGVNDSFDVLIADTIIGSFGWINAVFPAPEGGGGEGECGEEGCFEALSSFSSGDYGYDINRIVDAIGSLDVLRVTVTSVPATVPVPAAAWLMGSALGLLGWVRRKQKRKI